MARNHGAAKAAQLPDDLTPEEASLIRAYLTIRPDMPLSEWRMVVNQSLNLSTVGREYLLGLLP